MDELKERILSESSQLFMNKGCKSLTMDGIANNLGVSKRTIYETFKDKEDLLEQAIIYKWGKSFQETMELLSDSSHNVLESILKMCYSTSEVVIQMHMNFIAEMKKFYPKVYQNTFLKLKGEQMGFYERIMQRGIEEGLISKDVDPRITTYIIGDLNELMAKDMQYPYNLYTKKELFFYTVIKYIRGISTIEGIKIIDEYFEKEGMDR